MSAVITYCREMEFPTQPPMLTFKQFLSQQEDNISDQDAIKKYNEYKDEFKRQQINEFFLAHKEEEWYIVIYLSLTSLDSKSESCKVYLPSHFCFMYNQKFQCKVPGLMCVIND